MDQALLTGSPARLLVALAVGLLIGIERERRKGEGATRSAAGVRTFALIALLGGLAVQAGSPALLAVAASFTALAALAGYWLGDRRDPGLTTEVALLVAFLLGALAQTRPSLSIGAAVVVTVLLAAKAPLHRLVRETLTEQELDDGLIFSIAALVVLPVLPHHAIGPFGLVNPYAIWRLAVVLMGLSAAGYIAMRILGARYGLVIMGFASGFVSSTAAIAALGGRARNDEQLSSLCAGGAVASVLGSLLYLIGLVATANLGVLFSLMKPLAVAVAATLAYAVLLAGVGRTKEHSAFDGGRAFDLATIATFTGLVFLFALVSTGLVLWFGKLGALGGAAITGLIDVHAAAVSLATLIASSKIGTDVGALGILIALSVNMVSKIPAAFALGPSAFARRTALGLVVLLCGLWSGYGWAVLGTIDL
jgi:uncharacterized membrane protein (DUF4010 family)